MIIRFTDKDLEGSNFIPEGETEVVISKLETAKSKNGADMLIVHLKDRLAREEKEYFSLSEKALWKLAAFAKAAGFAQEDLKASGLNVPKLAGKHLLMVKTQVGVRRHEGKELKDYEKTFYKLQKEAAENKPASSESFDDIF